jgi:hypothetical protein
VGWTRLYENKKGNLPKLSNKKSHTNFSTEHHQQFQPQQSHQLERESVYDNIEQMGATEGEASAVPLGKIPFMAGVCGIL